MLVLSREGSEESFRIGNLDPKRMAESARVEAVTGIRAKIENSILILNGEPRILVVAEPLVHVVEHGRVVLRPGRCPTCMVFSPGLFGNFVNSQYRLSRCRLTINRQ